MIFLAVSIFGVITACDREGFVAAVGVDRYYTLLRTLYVIQGAACIAATVAYSLLAKRLMGHTSRGDVRT